MSLTHATFKLMVCRTGFTGDGPPCMIIPAFILLAQAESSGEQPAAPVWWNLVPFGILLVVLAVSMLMRGNRDRREAEEFQKGLRKNDRVLTAAGIYGTISALPETGDEVLLKIDENARIRVSRGSIRRNLTREEEAAAARDKKK
ncbi:MAG: preprotein translocase subunit YajC [Planctomycetes bacterium]|nr:preprotein translocase subunit YajC [Planctomycetota bacterium]